MTECVSNSTEMYHLLIPNFLIQGWPEVALYGEDNLNLGPVVWC